MSFLLINDVADYCDFAGIEDGTAGCYRRSARCFSDFLNRPATRDDLSERLVNKWLAYVASRRAPKTVLGRKRGITPVWNWLADRGLANRYNPTALRRIKVEHKPVVAWSTGDVRALIAGASDIEGHLTCGVAASDLMAAWARIAYETGFRPVDMRLLRWDDFVSSGVANIIQHKTKYPIAKRLSNAAVAALEPLRGHSDRVFILTKSGLVRWEKRLFTAAEKHGFRRRKGQGCGTLRKTHATEVCRVSDPQQAALSLGHVSGPTIALQSYIAADAIGVSETPQELIDALARTAETPRDRVCDRNLHSQCG